MRQVLVFDDRTTTQAWVEDCLEETDIEAVYCQTINEAKSAWSKYSKSINMIVLDIMMPSRGLSEELRQKAKDNYLTGWVWLCSNKQFENPGHGKKIIIYSAYLPELEAHISSPEATSAEKRLYSEIIAIKKGSVEAAENLKEHILSIRKLL